MHIYSFESVFSLRETKVYDLITHLHKKNFRFNSELCHKEVYEHCL